MASGMTSIGDRLRRQRLQNRISLETVSLETKIGVRMLEAIEADQFEKLPLFRSVSLENNGEYYVRVRAHTTPRNMAFVWPWQADDVVGLAKFTLVR